MNKYLQLSFDIIIKKPILYLSIVLQLFFSIFFALDSVNYLSSSLYTDYFCFPLTLKPFICNMPINSELYAGQIDNNYLPETSDFDYSKLVKIESISKACSFIMYDQYGNNYEIRAYSSDITDNLNIKLKKEFNCPESNQYIKGLTSLQNCKGDNLTLYLYDKSAELNIKFSGIVEAPYYYIDNSCINAQGSFSDIFKFTSQNELTFLNYEIIWVNYDDIAQFINQNELDTTKDSLAYNEFIFLKSDITQEEIEINEKELLELGIDKVYEKINSLKKGDRETARGNLELVLYYPAKFIIPRNVRLAEAPSYGKPAIYYDSKCRGTLAYKELAEEFIELEEDII